MYQVNLNGFSLVFNLVVKLKRNGKPFFKYCRFWQPRKGVDYQLLNNVSIQKSNSTKAEFRVEDDLGQFSPYFKENGNFWKFSTAAPLIVKISDPESNKLTVFTAQRRKKTDGTLYLWVDSEEKMPQKKTVQKEENQKEEKPLSQKLTLPEELLEEINGRGNKKHKERKKGVDKLERKATAHYKHKKQELAAA